MNKEPFTFQWVSFLSQCPFSSHFRCCGPTCYYYSCYVRVVLCCALISTFFFSFTCRHFSCKISLLFSADFLLTLFFGSTPPFYFLCVVPLLSTLCFCSHSPCYCLHSHAIFALVYNRTQAHTQTLVSQPTHLWLLIVVALLLLIPPFLALQASSSSHRFFFILCRFFSTTFLCFLLL